MAAEVESPAILKVFVGAMSVMHRCPSAHSEAMWVWRQGANIRYLVAHYRDIVFPAQVGYSAQLLRSEYAAGGVVWIAEEQYRGLCQFAVEVVVVYPVVSLFGNERVFHYPPAVGFYLGGERRIDGRHDDDTVALGRQGP